MPESSPQLNNQVGTLFNTQGEGEQQGTPKCPRINTTHNGSCSAPPRVPGGTEDQQGRQRDTNTVDVERRRKLTGKHIMTENLTLVTLIM
jgi:hypothetical protein